MGWWLVYGFVWLGLVLISWFLFFGFVVGCVVGLGWIDVEFVRMWRLVSLCGGFWVVWFFFVCGGLLG